MKVYIAAKWARRFVMREVSHAIVAEGHVVTSRWLWQDADENEKEWTEGALMDVGDVRAADVCLTYPEEYRSKNTGGGRHFEFGLAYGLGKKLIIVGKPEIIFHHLPGISICEDLKEAIDWLDLMQEKRRDAYLMTGPIHFHKKGGGENYGHHSDENGWYYWNEARTKRFGPFEYQSEAEDRLNNYITHTLGSEI